MEKIDSLDLVLVTSTLVLGAIALFLRKKKQQKKQELLNRYNRSVGELFDIRNRIN